MRGRKWSRRQSRGSPAAGGEGYGEVGCLPAAHGGPHTGAGLDAQRRLWLRGELALEQDSGRTCGPVDPWREEPILEQVCWQDLWPHGRSTLEQSAPERLHLVERTNAEAVCEELQPLGRTHIGEVHGALSSMSGTSCWSRGGVWGVLPLRRKEWQRQHVMNWPQPLFSVP